MNLRRAWSSVAAGLVLSAAVLLTGGAADATDSRAGRASALAERPVSVRGVPRDIIADNPAEVRALLRSLGVPFDAASELIEWMPATASTIDGVGGGRALTARLSLEYGGAVPGADVARVVDRVTRELRRNNVAGSRLQDVAEARCRRELTDRLARELAHLD